MREVHYARTTCYDADAAALRREVVRFVRGVRRPRTAMVTMREIAAWFMRTDAARVNVAVGELIVDGVLAIARTSFRSPIPHNARYVYGIADDARALLLLDDGAGPVSAQIR